MVDVPYVPPRYEDEKPPLTITRLTSAVPCSATRHTTYLNDRPGTDKQCNKSSVMRINGNALCRQHAGSVAVDILLTHYPVEFE